MSRANAGPAEGSTNSHTQTAAQLDALSSAAQEMTKIIASSQNPDGSLRDYILRVSAAVNNAQIQAKNIEKTKQKIDAKMTETQAAFHLATNKLKEANTQKTVAQFSMEKAAAMIEKARAEKNKTCLAQEKLAAQQAKLKELIKEAKEQEEEATEAMEEVNDQRQKVRDERELVLAEGKRLTVARRREEKKATTTLTRAKAAANKILAEAQAAAKKMMCEVETMKQETVLKKEKLKLAQAKLKIREASLAQKQVAAEKMAKTLATRMESLDQREEKLKTKKTNLKTKPRTSKKRGLDASSPQKERVRTKENSSLGATASPSKKRYSLSPAATHTSTHRLVRHSNFSELQAASLLFSLRRGANQNSASPSKSPPKQRRFR
jgi:chromosome segregation ATPase